MPVSKLPALAMPAEVLPSFTLGGEPAGVVVQGDAMQGGQGHAFIGRDHSGYMLITLLAMCDPPDNYWEPASLVWMEGRIADASMLVLVNG